MSKALKWFLRTLIAGIITTIAAIAVDLVKLKPVLSTLKVWLKNSIEMVQKIMVKDIKVWWLLILFTVVLICWFSFILIRNIFYTHQRFLKYKADSFKFFVWRWEWHYNDIIDKWEIESLHPICEDKKCLGKLELHKPGFHAIFPRYICVKCNTAYKAGEYPEDVEKKIISNIKHGTF